MKKASFSPDARYSPLFSLRLPGISIDLLIHPRELLALRLFVLAPLQRQESEVPARRQNNALKVSFLRKPPVSPLLRLLVYGFL